MEVSIALDIFQDIMSVLLQYMIHVRVYIDYLIIISKYIFKNHMDMLDDILLYLKTM